MQNIIYEVLATTKMSQSTRMFAATAGAAIALTFMAPPPPPTPIGPVIENMRDFIRALPFECSRHILGYTYSPQNPRLLKEVRDMEEKRALFSIYYKRVEDSFLEIYGSRRIFSVLLGDLDIYIKSDECTVKNRNRMRAIIDREWTGRISSEKARAIVRRVWPMMSLPEIGEYMNSLDKFLIMVWYIDNENLNRLPPYKWMYDENLIFKQQYFATINMFRSSTMRDTPFPSLHWQLNHGTGTVVAVNAADINFNNVF